MRKLLAYKTFLMTYHPAALQEAIARIKECNIRNEYSIAESIADETAKEHIKFYSDTNPGFAWEPLTVVQTSCEYGHDDPAPNCNCGVYSSYDFDRVVEANRRAYNALEPGADMIPVIGVIQVLGHTEVNKIAKTLRSKGGFIWGIVRPSFLNTKQFNAIQQLTYNGYRFAEYRNAEAARKDVNRTLGYYDLYEED